jgi:hypothetical protein
VRAGAVHRRALMSIEKESSGLPEMNVHKRTTKVNLGVIAGVLVFLAIAVSVVVWLSATRR